MEWILTWLWQGMLVAFAAEAVLRMTPRLSAATRYLVLWAALVAVLLIAPLALVDVHVHPVAVGAAGTPAPVTAPAPAATTSPLALLSLPALPSWLAIVLCVMWGTYICLRGEAIVRSVRQMRAIKRRSTRLPTGLERRLSRWQSVRSQGRRATLGVSAEVPAACMVGLGDPLIVVPPSLLTSLDADDLDHVVLHEYGHVQRRDDWSNLLQVCIEAVCGWHPAVWRLGRSLRLEREIACDDWVLARQGSARAYASCLATVASIMTMPASSSLAPGVARSPHELTHRVLRLLDHRHNAAVRPSAVVSVTATLILATAVTVLGDLAPLVTFAGITPPPTVTSGERTARVVTETAGFRAQVAATQPEPRTRGPLPASIARPRPAAANSLDIDVIAPLMTLRGNATVRSQAQDVVAPQPLATKVVVPTAVTLQPVVPRSGRPPASEVRRDRQPNTIPWSAFAKTGRAIGTTATEAGLATAGAFAQVGSRAARIFGGDRR